jgi:lysophospholipase L1-like esterase
MDSTFPRRNRLLSGLFAAILATTGIVAGGAAPAGAAPASTTASIGASSVVDYVALGDSFAAGQGGGRALDGCKHTRLGYPALLDLPKSIRLTANPTCASAKAHEVLNSQITAATQELRVAELVTVTVGGNDLGAPQIAAACGSVPISPDCEQLVAEVPARLASAGAALGAIVGALDQAAPDARIVVTGYPRLFERVPATHPNFDLIRQVNVATDALNQTIMSVVDAARLQRMNVRYVDVTGLFAGHGIGSRFPWIHASGGDIFHPNVFGYSAYALAIGKALLR